MSRLHTKWYLQYLLVLFQLHKYDKTISFLLLTKWAKYAYLQQ